MTNTDLFGNPVEEAPVPTVKPRPVTNDMAPIERVLKVACTDGYALVGRQERVYRVGAKDTSGFEEITGVPAEDADAVYQLISARYLVVGGQHTYRHRNHREGQGHAVLVPRSTRYMSARWGALHRPATWPQPRERKAG